MMGIPMRHLLAVGCLFLAWAVIPPNAANATCGEECDQQYSSDVDDCHSNFGDDPADAGDLARCIRDARDDYGGCVSNCAAQMVFSSLARTSANFQCEAVLVARLVRARWNDGGAVMPRQVGVGPVDRRFMEAGLGDPGLEIVADRLARDAAEISEGADMRRDPIGQLLAPHRLGVGEIRRAQASRRRYGSGASSASAGLPN
jgi:hypothetical protein